MPKTTPVNGHLLLKPIEGDDLKTIQSGGALSRTSGETDRLSYGRVISYDPDPSIIQGNHIEPVDAICMEHKVGQVIVYQRLAAHNLLVGGEDYHLLAWDQVIAIIEEDK